MSINAPPLPLKDGSFHIDSTGLAAIMRCPRYAWHLLWLRRESAARDGALDFGRILHKAWEWRYRQCGSKAISDEQCVSQEALLEEWFAQAGPIDDGPEAWRNAGRAKEVMALYNKEYREEAFEVLKVEEGFTFRLGVMRALTVSHLDGRPLIIDVPLVYNGRIDMIVRHDRQLSPLDWKHSAYSDTEKELAKYEMSHQMMGYCNAVTHLTGEPCNKAIVRFAIVRKPSDRKTTLPRTEFAQHEFRYSQAKLDDWKRDTICIVENWLRQCASEPPPMHRTSCAWPKRCQFFDVCTLDGEEARMSWLMSSAFRPYLWSPLNTAEQNGEA